MVIREKSEGPEFVYTPTCSVAFTTDGKVIIHNDLSKAVKRVTKKQKLEYWDSSTLNGMAKVESTDLRFENNEDKEFEFVMIYDPRTNLYNVKEDKGVEI